MYYGIDQMYETMYKEEVEVSFGSFENEEVGGGDYSIKMSTHSNNRRFMRGLTFKTITNIILKGLEKVITSNMDGELKEGQSFMLISNNIDENYGNTTVKNSRVYNSVAINEKSEGNFGILASMSYDKIGNPQFTIISDIHKAKNQEIFSREGDKVFNLN